MHGFNYTWLLIEKLVKIKLEKQKNKDVKWIFLKKKLNTKYINLNLNYVNKRL